jgi:hypothetical protein
MENPLTDFAGYAKVGGKNATNLAANRWLHVKG